MDTKFQIGDDLWYPTWDAFDNYVTCPDCGGTGRLRVTFHDETQVSIDCRNCSSGYDEPSGRVRVYDRKAAVKYCVVSGLEIEGTTVRYRTSDSRVLDEADLFRDHDEAMAAAVLKAGEASHQERERIATKEKDTRTWAWNASYHRGKIKQAHKDIEYHTAKLAVAAIKAKEDRVKT